MIDRIVTDLGLNSYTYRCYSIFGLFIVLLIITITAAYFYYLLIMIPLHELGHLLFTKLSGGTMISYRINKFTFTKLEGKWKVKRYTHQGSVGQCIVCPKEYTEGRHPFVLGMLGGPIIDFNMFATSLMIYLHGPFQAGFIHLFFALAAFIELLSALQNGIPMKINGINNDGMCTLLMIRDKQAVKSWYTTMHVFQQLKEGKTYKDMNQEMFLLPTEADLRNDMIAYHKLYTCYYYMDLKQWEKAFECLREIDMHGSELSKRKIRSDQLVLYIKLGKSPSEIDELYRRTKKLLQHNKYDFNYIRTRMVYELYKDPSKENRNRILHEIIKIARVYPYEGEVVFNRNLIID